ncbi:flagellar protein FlaG [Halomonas sp. TBZ9]|uniref:Flagellar protein FlaG n=1 Tax=Vreelandella azerica TaxID=2732867 RepID=A0A7Y3XBJ2_9GAMM|nr:flagellar protein FlaG [Halomonas azerica]NOG32326.1 flagellar protein FlaG [Halomonas azerica]
MYSPLIDAVPTLTPPARQENILRQPIDPHTQPTMPATVLSAQQEEQQKRLDAAELAEPVERINAVMNQRGLEFEINDENSRVITRVVDRESGEVIRQIPAEEVLRLAERLGELQGGLISVQA